jgi:putative membrane protein
LLVRSYAVFIQTPEKGYFKVQGAFMNKTILRNTALNSALAGCISLAAAAQSTVGADMSSGSADAGQSGSSQVSSSDKMFVMKAAEGGMAEVELAKLAVEKGSSSDVKTFGQRMVDDHSKANDQLKQIASNKGIEVPTDLNVKDKATEARLATLTGPQFDQAYMADMVKDHQQDVADFRNESKMGKDFDVKGFAWQTLPTLQDHLNQARSLAPSVSSKTQTNSTTP